MGGEIYRGRERERERKGERERGEGGREGGIEKERERGREGDRGEGEREIHACNGWTTSQRNKSVVIKRTRMNKNNGDNEHKARWFQRRSAIESCRHLSLAQMVYVIERR